MENPNKKNTHVNVIKMMKASVNMSDVVTKHLSGLQYLRIHPSIEDRQIMFMWLELSYSSTLNSWQNLIMLINIK